MENLWLKRSIGKADLHSLGTLVLEKSFRWDRNEYPKYILHPRLHAYTHTHSSTSQQHSRWNCSDFLKEEIKTPGNILHLLCHIYFLWQPSVLFPWDSFRAYLSFSLSGNLYRFPKGNILSSEKSCQAPGTWLVRNQASWWSTWQNKTPGDSQVMKTRTSWMCLTICMYCKWKRFCSTVRVISHVSKSFSFFSFIFQLKV